MRVRSMSSGVAVAAKLPPYGPHNRLADTIRLLKLVIYLGSTLPSTETVTSVLVDLRVDGFMARSTDRSSSQNTAA